MNILEIIVIVITVLLALSGFRKGFVKKLAGMLSLVLSIVLVSALLPHITSYLKENTPIYTGIVDQCTNVIEEQVAKSLLSGGQGNDGSVTQGDSGDSQIEKYRSMGRSEIAVLMEQYGYDSSVLDGLSDEQIEQYKEQYIGQYFGGSQDQESEGTSREGTNGLTAGLGTLTRIEQTEIIQNLPLPEFLKELLLDYNNDEGYSSLKVSTFPDYVINFIATGILNIISFLTAIVVVQLILWLVFTALGVVSHIPVIRVVNRLAGVLLGLIQALFLIWVFFLILSFVSATDIGLQLMEMVQESELLRSLYESNIFLQIVLRGAAFFG